MKIKSEQIIIVIVAFLVGVALSALVFNKKNDADLEINDPSETTLNSSETEEELEEGSTEESEESEAGETSSSTQEETKTAASNNTESKTTTTTTTTATSKPSTSFVSGNCNTGLSAYKDEKLNAIVLNWSPCDSDNFQFYKLVKSSKNTSPSYPADPVAFSSSNKNAANFVDKTVAARTTYYYRLCVVQRLGAVNCSNVASASF